MRRPRLLALGLALAAVLAGGCKGKCRSLSEKLCDCAANSVAKTTCLQNASAKEAANPPTAADEAVCDSLLKGCDCRDIGNADGKKRCGLAK